MNSPPLQQIQQELQAHLLTQNNNIIKAVAKPIKGTPAERLAVYGDGYRLRLLEALAIDFEVLQQVVGADSFEQIGQAYIDAYPSHHFSIDVFGKHMAHFLAVTEPYCQQPYLSELAAYLWALNKTIDAPDAPLLTGEQIAAIPQENWPAMCLSFHPSVQPLLTHRWNSVALWQAALNKQTIPPIQRLKKTSYYVVWRKGIQSFYSNLQQREEAYVFQALQKGKTFGTLCEGLLRWLPEDQVAGYAVNLLLRWLNDGMLCSVKIKL